MLPLLVTTARAADSNSVEALKDLGKNLFFDTKLSIPANNQACASCHDPVRGWTLPDSKVNGSTVVAPGAKPHALGNIKPPSNAYATEHARFQPAPGVAIGALVLLPGWGGGNFWDGRAEGCGASAAVPDCPVVKDPGAAVSETIRFGDLPASRRIAPNDFTQFLGSTADQALNPFPNNVEQNIREKNVCQNAKTAKYKSLYVKAYGVPIDCSPNPQESPAYRTSFKRLALAIGAWQSSEDVNSFSSPRDKALAADVDKQFPLDDLSDTENRGHDLFYGVTSTLNPAGKNAGCAACHNGLPGSIAAFVPDDPTGVAPKQLYTDHRFHHIGTPYNREIPGVAKGVKVGLAAHAPSTTVFDFVSGGNVTRTTPPGFFKTPTLRNVAKGASGSFTKAYFHNGYFKTLKQVVQFYNTRDEKDDCFEKYGIENATAAEALKNNCWPRPEFDSPGVFGGGNNPGDGLGNLGLTSQEEDAIVAYMQTLTDTKTPKAP